jgi:hypothetical protein
MPKTTSGRSGKNDDRVARFDNNTFDQHEGRGSDREESVDWQTEVWDKLRVLDPCVPERNCPN